MKKIWIVVLVFIHFGAFSQVSANADQYWSGEDNRPAMIAATNCYVRSQPSLDGKLLDSLQLGKEIVILKQTENFLNIKGIKASWVQIEFENQKGITQKAFLWKGFIALGFVKTPQNIFLTALDHVVTDAKDSYKSDDVFLVKVLDLNKKVLVQKNFKKNSFESFYFENKNLGTLGLSNLKNIYRINFMAESCGATSLYYYWGWNGTDLLVLPQRQCMADAGAYYYDEAFVFPSEKGGKPNSILKKIKQAEINKDDLMDVEEWTETFVWNGQKAVFSKKDKPKKYKEKL
ncbi:MAG: hypothetical protein QG594_353 [Bacteroidota bacterium]|nr:hypothetical protein [Bacteroidota bacterium]